MLLLLGALVVGSLMSVSRRTMPVTDRWQQYDECLLAAQSALEKVKSDIYQGFREEHQLSQSWNDLSWVVNNAADFSYAGMLGGLLDGDALSDRKYLAAELNLEVSNSGVIGVSTEERVVLVTNRVTVTWGDISRIIEEVVQYKLNRSSVFDHAYFINNFGWFHGVDCVVNGDIRSNFDVELKSRDLVLNGHTYATGVNDLKKPYQTWSWNTYKNNFYSSFFRPVYHVDLNKHNKDSVFEWGYEDSGRHNYASELEMPYIGDLSDYKYYAEEQDGTVSTGGVTVVDNVYSNAGPSGVSGAADHGSLYLYGTEDDPIVIDGPVVVDGDVIIKGYYTGQGTIYAKRNIHIIDSVIAVTPSQWAQPDTAENFYENTLPDNLDADFLGLVARGAVILGDPDNLSSYNTYLRPSFTDAYPVSVTDADIGYVSYVSDGTSYFDGNYTGVSGERCSSSDPSLSIERKYYDPSVSSDMMDSWNPAARIDQIDAFIYNNHLTAGQLSADSMINGGIICRDEALIPAGRVYMNWDPRVALDNDFTPFLPLELGPAETILWREVSP